MARNWTLISSHGTLLLLLAAKPTCTIRQAAMAAGLTERRVSSIIADLEQAGFVIARRQGRTKSYEVNGGARFAIGALPGPYVANLLAMAGIECQAAAASTGGLPDGF